MKFKTLMCALGAAACLASCNYDDADLWNAVNGQETRISALEKWQKEVNEQLANLQGVLTATDLVTDVDEVTKDDGTKGYKISFLHAKPITLYYNDNSEVSGTDENTIGVAQDDKGWYWTRGGEALLVENEKVYVKGGESVTAEVQSDGSWKLVIGENEVTVPAMPIVHPVQSVATEGSVVTITLSDDSTVQLVKYVNLSTLLLDEYTNTVSGEKEFDLNLPEGYIVDTLGSVPTGWTISVVEGKLKVTFPESGEAAVKFVISDGVSQTIVKNVTFKVAEAQWVTVNYDGTNPIVIPSGASKVKVVSTGAAGAPALLLSNVCNILKENSLVTHIDLSEVKHSLAFPANAFYMNKPDAGAEDATKDQNRSIKEIIMPSSQMANLFDRSFKNCVALEKVTFPGKRPTNATAWKNSWFEGCTQNITIYVPSDQLDDYTSKWSAHSSNITIAAIVGEE